MWGRSRDTDRERNAREQERRIRGESPLDERPKGYAYFVAAVVGVVAVVFVLLIYFS